MAMGAYITLYNFTDQGSRTIMDTVKRAEAVKAAAAKNGVAIKDFYWLQGAFDVAVIFEAPDEATATAAALTVLKAGNVRGQTMRAFTPAEMSAILAKVA
jgi:uncharacterized protein with GYD domain